MRRERRKINSVLRAEYNPRVTLQPGDPEFDALAETIKNDGLLELPVLNIHNNTLVGGHQKLSVLEYLGETECDFSIVDIDDPIKEKRLNLYLNKAQGDWDYAKMEEIIEGLGDRATETGFTLPEIDAMRHSIEDALDTDFLEEELAAIEDTFNVTLTFDIADKERIMNCIKEQSKNALVELMIEAAEKGADADGL